MSINPGVDGSFWRDGGREVEIASLLVTSIRNCSFFLQYFPNFFSPQGSNSQTSAYIKMTWSAR